MKESSMYTHRRYYPEMPMSGTCSSFSDGDYTPVLVYTRDEKLPHAEHGYYHRAFMWPKGRVVHSPSMSKVLWRIMR